MSYRILLTGAQGTGKSTLTRAIATSFENEGCADVSAFVGVGQQVALAGRPTGAHADPQTVRMFVDLHRRRATTAAGSILIFDRCLLDALAYAQVLQCFPRKELEALRVETVESSKRAAQLLWLRVTHDYPVNSPDDESPEFRRTIDAAIGQLARENGLSLQEYAVPPQSFTGIARDVFATWRDTAACRP